MQINTKTTIQQIKIIIHKIITKVEEKERGKKLQNK